MININKLTVTSFKSKLCFQIRGGPRPQVRARNSKGWRKTGKRSMSVFGGDSWAREAQQRKRRVDDLMLSSSSSTSSAADATYKKLSSGKFVCLVCPHNPVLDSPLILSMHMNGSRHVAAETRMRGKELSRQEEINKRIALAGETKDISNSVSLLYKLKGSEVQNNPLIKKTRKAILETHYDRIPDPNFIDGCNPAIPTTSNTLNCYHHNSYPNHLPQEIQHTISAVPANHYENKSHTMNAFDPRMLSDWNAELRKRREKELQFSAAGWKRDGHGKWYRDENAEFDSDEEDPNACLS